jgi:hypothetical protein
MDFVWVAVVFGLFILGLVFAFQGFVGKEINAEGQWLRMPIDLDQPGIEHPPERHRLRLFLIGLGLMVLAVLLGIVVLS